MIDDINSLNKSVFLVTLYNVQQSQDKLRAAIAGILWLYNMTTNWSPKYWVGLDFFNFITRTRTTLTKIYQRSCGQNTSLDFDIKTEIMKKNKDEETILHQKTSSVS